MYEAGGAGFSVVSHSSRRILESELRMNRAEQKLSLDAICFRLPLAASTSQFVETTTSGLDAKRTENGRTMKSKSGQQKVVLLSLLLGFVVFCLSNAWGQISKGGIAGTVVDRSGAVVPNAKVTATELSTGLSRTAMSGADGTFTVPLLDPGNYRLDIEAQGFKKLTRSPITVQVTEVAGLGRVSLDIGDVSETVTVTGQAPLLETEAATTGNVFGTEMVKDLPLVTRNFTQLLALQAGVVTDVPQGAAFGKGTQGFSDAGSRYYDNSVLIDGTNAVSTMSGGSFDISVPAPDTVEEFKVQSSLYSAEYGMAGGGSVNLVTKTGTNNLHGNVYEFFRNNALNANDYFYKASQLEAGNGNKAPVLKQNQFGGTIGGPIQRNKTFFFFGYQGTRQVNGAAPGFVFTLPTYPYLPAGDRSNAGQLRAALGAIYGGRTGFPVGLCAADINCVKPDGSNINPVTIAILQAKLPNGQYFFPSFPQSAFSDGLGGLNGGQIYSNASFSLPGRYSEDQYVGNVTHQFSPRQLLSLKVFTAGAKTIAIIGNLPGFTTDTQAENQNATLAYTFTFSPWLVNEAHGSFVHVSLVSRRQDPFGASDVGMKPAPDGATGKFPWLMIAQAGISAGTASAYTNNSENQTGVSDTISLTRGRNAIRMGASFIRHALPQSQDYGRNGALWTYSFTDFLLGQDAAQNGLAAIGLPYSNLIDTAAATGDFSKSYRFNDTSIFFQDDLAVRSNLTLNLGLRWDYFAWPHDIYGRLAAFNPALIGEGAYGIPTAAQGYTGFTLAKDYARLHPDKVIPDGVSLVDNTLVNGGDFENFGPRIGFAWQPKPKLSVRGGYGIFYPRSSTEAADDEEVGQPFNNTIQSIYQAQGSLQDPFTFMNLPPDSAYPLWTPRTYTPGATVGYYAQVLDPKARNPYVQQWNFGIQQEIGNNFLLELTYLGSHGLRLLNTLAGNQTGIASPSNPIRGITTNTTTNYQDRVPIAGILTDRGLAMDYTNGASGYNAFLVTANKRMSHGLQFLSSFTWGKSVDNNSLNSLGGCGLCGSAGNAQPPGNNNLNNHWGLSTWDRTLRSTTSLLYELPDPIRNGSNPLDKLTSGWQTAFISTFQSGQPITFYVSTVYSAVKQGGYLTPDLAPGKTLDDVRGSGSIKSRLNHYFKSPGLAPGTDAPLPGTAFLLPGPLDYGQLGRGLPIRTPGQHSVDFSLIKHTPIHDSINTEFRAEFFNALNWSNFGAPDAEVDDLAFGQISSMTVSPRIIQFALKVNF